MTPGQEQPRIDGVSRMTATSGPTPDNREISPMMITSVRIKRTEIGTMIEIERVDVSIELREDLKIIGEILMPILMEVMYLGVMD